MGEYARFMSSAEVPAGVTRLQLGPRFCHHDVVFCYRVRPLMLPLLLALVELPPAYLQGSAAGAALAPKLFLDLLQLLLLSVSVQLALPACLPLGEDEDDFQ